MIKEGPGARVNPQAVIQILTAKITNLIVENAMLQARIGDLEVQVQQLEVDKPAAEN